MMFTTDIIVFTFYPYIMSYFFVTAAFLGMLTLCIISCYGMTPHTLIHIVYALVSVMRIYEPDAERWYKFPGGKIGAYGVTILCFGLMMTFAIWAAVSYMAWAAIVWAICNVIFIMLSVCAFSFNPYNE